MAHVYSAIICRLLGVLQGHAGFVPSAVRHVVKAASGGEFKERRVYISAI